MSVTLDPVFVYGNYVEACFWAGMGTVVFFKNEGHAGGRILSATFIVFGVSDVVEAHTGAWYNPWWLLAWKTGCVLLILSLGMKLHRASKTRR